jgi:GDP-L-fucose synthase
MQNNLMESAFGNGCRKFLFLGSSCIYPKLAAQPIREDSLLSGPLEPTNDAYALAKITGVRLAQAYRDEYGKSAISAMPTNLYGPGDNFDLETSHVLPALIRKFHDAKIKGDKEVTLWGSGSPKREFLHADDLGSACLFLLEHYDSDTPINVGVGKDIPIQALADLIQEIVGFTGKIIWDTSKPDGTPQKLLDVSRINQLGWEPSIDLRSGLEQTYKWYVDSGLAQEPMTNLKFAEKKTEVLP